MDVKIRNLLVKYLNSQCTDAELRQVQAILQSNQYEKEWAAVLEEDAKKVMHTSPIVGLNTDKSDQLLERIIKSTDMKSASGNRRWWIRLAASVLILLTAGLAFVLLLSIEELSQTVTMAGEQTEVLLPDGSRVWLNDMSTLRYPDKFDGDNRNIYLEGNAFFEVISNPSQPFLVHSGEFTVQVLGTSFDVRAYEEDRSATVTVASGKVSVTGPPAGGPDTAASNANNKSYSTLTPGDQLTYDRQNLEYIRQTVSPGDIRLLNSGGLVFQNQTLDDIVRALERRYNVRFRFDEKSAGKQRLTFKPNSSDLEEVLQVLSLVSGLEYKILNNGVVIMK